MRSVILGFRRALTAVPQKNNPCFTPRRTYQVNREKCDAHMNELPVPCGPWGPWYKAKQDFYNKVFVGGVLWFVFSFAMMIYTDSIHPYFSPPARPGPPSDIEKDPCEEE